MHSSLGSPVDWETLPHEICTYIFSYLTRPELLVAGAVNRFFAKIACDNMLWKNFVQKGFSHLKIEERKDTSQVGETYKKVYQSLAIAHKIASLEAWRRLFYSPLKEDFSHLPVEEHYKELCDYLYCCYVTFSRDYEAVGHVFAIVDDDPSQLLDFELGYDHFSFKAIEREHADALVRLLQEAIQLHGQLTIECDTRISPRTLNPLHIEVLRRVFDSLEQPIHFSLCCAGVRTENLAFFCELIRQGKVKSLMLDGNEIDDAGLQLLLDAKASAPSDCPLFIKGNPCHPWTREDSGIY